MERPSAAARLHGQARQRRFCRVAVTNVELGEVAFDGDGAEVDVSRIEKADVHEAVAIHIARHHRKPVTTEGGANSRNMKAIRPIHTPHRKRARERWGDAAFERLNPVHASPTRALALEDRRRGRGTIHRVPFAKAEGVGLMPSPPGSVTLRVYIESELPAMILAAATLIMKVYLELEERLLQSAGSSRCAKSPWLIAPEVSR